MKRRRLLAALPATVPAWVALSGWAAALGAMTPGAAQAQAGNPASTAGARAAEGRVTRAVPATGERWPVVGMGTWLTFDVGENLVEQAQRRAVLERFFAAGGGMIDSSPMYGRSQALLGQLLPQVPHRERLVAATKVWTPFDRLGPTQIGEAIELWGVPRFDVMLVHNLLNWRDHWKTLQREKAAGRVRLIGASTSHGRDAEQVAQVLRSERLDVLQITYNLADESAEPLMRLAAERGTAVVINRPFDGGALFSRVQGKALPPWAAEVGAASWAQFFLRWVVGHPAVTCAIPATREPAHMDQNMGAGASPLPDAAQRQRMRAYVQSV